MDKSNHGGTRPGAGRKPNSGAFKEPTVVKRIPASAVPLLEEWLLSFKNRVQLPADVRLPAPLPSHIDIPIFEDKVRAGFPTPATDHTDRSIDLNDYLITNQTATILLRAQGDSMVDAGIGDGDMLVVDRSAEPHDGAIVIAAVDNAFTVKTLRRPKGDIELHPANAQGHYPVIRPAPDEEIRLIGVVKWVIKKV